MLPNYAMHIPDGFLDSKTLGASAALALAGVSYSVYQTTNHLPRRRVPLMGLSASFIFAAQMLNFPIAGGTSGHLLGGTLAAILLGPSCAVLVVTSVLITQCFLFADGGLYALGANILNMAVVDAFTGYFFYCLIRRAIPTRTGQLIGAAFGAWIGTVLAAVVCSGQLAFSGRIPASTAFPTMVGVHSLIGIGEAIITTLVLSTILKTRPELLSPSDEPTHTRYRDFLGYGSACLAALALFVSPFASQLPDGLDHVAEKFGFAANEIKSPVPAIAPDYKIPHIASQAVATAVAGLVGTLFVFVLAIILARLLAARSSAAQKP